MNDHLQRKPIKVAGHLEEKRGVYQMILSWTDYGGNRERRSISTGLPVKANKKRAEVMLKETCKEHETMLANAPTTEELLFADFMEKWLDVIRSEVKPTTFGAYQCNVQKSIAPFFRKRGTLLCELIAADVNDYYEEKLKHVKAMTVIKHHANISKALKYAVEKGYISHSIMDKVKRPKAERFVGKFLKQSEVVELFEAVKGHKLELGVILGAFYGLRRSEIIGLRWESIDFEANTITIEHTVTVTRIDGKKVVVEGDTVKSKASFRTLPLVPSFREKLLEVREEQERLKKLCGKSYNTKHMQYVYKDLLGNRIKPDYLTSQFPEFMVKNGFRRLRFHDLRHSCASLLLASAVPLKQIQEWLGHSDFAITANTYAHLDFNSKLDSANSMTWINRTTMGKNSAKPEPTEETTNIRYVPGKENAGQQMMQTGTS